MPLILKQWASVIDKRTTVVCLHAAGQIRRVEETFETLAARCPRGRDRIGERGPYRRDGGDERDHGGTVTVWTNGPQMNKRQWKRPNLTIYRAGDPKLFGMLWNRYPGTIIGAAVQIRGRVFSLTWARPVLR